MSDNPEFNNNGNGQNDNSPASAILATIIIIVTVMIAFFFFVAMFLFIKDSGKEAIQELQRDKLKKSTIEYVERATQ